VELDGSRSISLKRPVEVGRRKQGSTRLLTDVSVKRFTLCFCPQMANFSTLLVALLAVLVVEHIEASADVRFGDKTRVRARGGQRARRQLAPANNEIQGSAIDFSQAQFDPDTGLMCVIKEEEVESIQKEPILECKHKEVEKCHYTYVTQFKPAQEEVCEESFEKTCQITYKKEVLKEMVKKCYRPLLKVCNGQGKEVCQTMYESSCSTRYIEKKPGKFVGDTRCEKLPIEVCGAGCVTEEGPEECHDKTVNNLVDIPEEICDLNPQKSCRLQTKLVPALEPKHECTIVPQEMCFMKFTAPKLVKKPLKSKWCLDPTPSGPGESYDENLARGDPIGAASSQAFTSSQQFGQGRSSSNNQRNLNPFRNAAV